MTLVIDGKNPEEVSKILSKKLKKSKAKVGLKKHFDFYDLRKYVLIIFFIGSILFNAGKDSVDKFVSNGINDATFMLPLFNFAFIILPHLRVMDYGRGSAQ